jgi:hypothetical protein
MSLNSADQITTAADLLAALRKGNNQQLEIVIGDFKIPVRLLNAQEEAVLIVKAKLEAKKKNPQGINQEVFESLESMKATMIAATTVGDSFMPVDFWNGLTSEEITDIYDRYKTLCKTINPSLETMTQDEILQVVSEVQKKSPTSIVNGLYGWQLQALGKYFLMTVVPALQQTVKEHG